MLDFFFKRINFEKVTKCGSCSLRCLEMANKRQKTDIFGISEKKANSKSKSLALPSS